MKLSPHLERLLALAAAKSGRWIALGGARDYEGAAASQLHLSKLPKPAPIASLPMDGAVGALAVLADDLLAAGTKSGSIALIDAAADPPQVVQTIRAHAGAVGALAADTLGRALASAGADGKLAIHALEVEAARPKLVTKREQIISTRALLAAAIDPAGASVAAGGEDATVRVLPLEGKLREMPAGEAAICALAFLGDGRIAAGSSDGSIRFLFLEGEVDEELRSGEHAHTGAVRGLVLGPELRDENDRELPRRLFSIGEDGALKAWQIDSKRKPRTLELGSAPLTSMVWIAPPPRSAKEKRGGTLAIGTKDRKLILIRLDAAGELAEDEREELGSELDRLEEEHRASSTQVREAAVRALRDIPEDEARVLLEQVLEEDRSLELRVLAAEAIGASKRRLSRPALRRMIGEKTAAEPFSRPQQNKELHAAALKALIALEPDAPLEPLRTALGSVHEDVRLEAVARLPELRGVSPLVPGLIAERLADRSNAVRMKALDALEQLEEKTSLEPLRLALARGTPDVRMEALLRLGLRGEASKPEGRKLVEGALDDDDGDVRARAFLIAVAAEKTLADRLKKRDPEMERALAELEKRGRLAARPADAAREDLEPLFAALAARHADTALRGASSLAILGDGRATGALLQLSREHDAGVRRASVSALAIAARTMPGDDRARGRLEWLLDDPDAEVRTAAFDALASLAAGTGATDGDRLELPAAALRASFEDVRVRALELLIALGGKKPPEAADRLLSDALDDEAARVRSEAFRTVWAWHAREPELALKRGAASRHADLRLRVVSELERQKGAWVRPMLLERVQDSASSVGLAAHKALTKTEDDRKKADVHLAAMASLRPDVRAAGAKGSVDAPRAAVRNVLVELVKDESPIVHLAAIEACDRLIPDDEVPIAYALGSVFYELRVRAGELLGKRRSPRAVAAMRELLTIPKTRLDRPHDELRRRAAGALADAGDTATIPFYVALLDDEDPVVREMGARGLAATCRAGNEGPLLAALGHADLPVRSWAAEGLARLGDARALPVLAGTQQHPHRPIRIGAILGFVALGAEGARGILLGLADPDREIQDLVFTLIIARDRALFDAGLAPDLLLSALSSAHPEIRFAAARALEARVAGEDYGAWTEELVAPKKPEKAAELKSWPAEPRRRALLAVLVRALASDDPPQRYAAARVLSLRPQPESFWSELALLEPGSAGRPRVPHTGHYAEERAPRKEGWIRRLFGRRGPARESEDRSATGRVLTVLRFAGAPKPSPVPPRGFDRREVLRLLFGTYTGLARQAPAPGEADETHRIRRDAIERVQALAAEASIGRDAALPALRRALSDPHHLVRKAGLAALRALYPAGSLEPLRMALEAAAADIGRAAIDELIALALAGDENARQLAKSAIDAPSREVRDLAVGRLERLYPKGSLEPWLIALAGRYADVRSSVVDRLVGSDDARVLEALARAMESDHPDLRLKAAAALARRGDARTIDVLAPFLRSEDRAVWREAMEALVALARAHGVEARARALAAQAIAARIEDDPDKTAERAALIEALGRIRDPAGAPILLRLLADEEAAIRDAAFRELLAIAGEDQERRFADGETRPRYAESLALPWIDAAAKSAVVELRLAAARALDAFEDRGAEELLARLIGDRDATVRVAACESLAFRAEHFAGATIEPLGAALRAGRRELVLPAAIGLAARRRPEAFQPLLLVLKAGEQAERERAVLALGTLGDARALPELLPFTDPKAELSDEDRALGPAVFEALGRMLPRLANAEEQARVRALVERAAREGQGEVRLRAILGLGAAGDDQSRAVLESIAADRDEDSSARRQAIEQLGRLARQASEAVLAESLEDEDASLRSEALRALARIYPDDPTKTSLLALASPHGDVSEPAASFLARRGDPRALVSRIAEIESAEVRRRLRLGLIRRGLAPVAELDALLRADAASGSRAEVMAARAEAARIAGASASAELAPAVAEAVARAAADWRARRAKPGAIAADEIVPEAEQAWRSSLWAALRVAAEVRGEARRAAADAEAPALVRREAMRYLARRGRAEDAKDVESALADGDAGVRSAAAEAFARLAPDRGAEVLGGIAVPDTALMAPLARASGAKLFARAEVRRIELPVLIGDRRTAELIAEASRAGKEGARIAAIAALGRIGGAEAKAALEAILAKKAEDGEVRAQAFKALRRLERAEAKVFAEGQDKERRGKHTGGGGGGGASDDDDGGAGDDGEDEEDGGEDGDWSDVNEELGLDDSSDDDDGDSDDGDSDDDGDHDADDDDDGESDDDDADSDDGDDE